MTPEEEMAQAEAEMEMAEAEATAEHDEPEATGMVQALEARKRMAESFDPTDPASRLGATLRGSVQGATAGYIDEGMGALAAGMAGASSLAERLQKYLAGTAPGRAVTRAMLPPGVADVVGEGAIDAIGQRAVEQRHGEMRQGLLGGDTPGEAYRTQRNFMRGLDRESEEKRPGWFYGGMLAGSTIAPGPKAVPKWAKSHRELAHFVPGAVTGGIAGVGASEREYFPLSGPSSSLGSNMLKDALPAGLLGGGIATGVGVGFEKGVPLVQRLLRRKADEAALRALGARAGISPIFKAMDRDPDEARQLGRVAIDEGLLPSGLDPTERPIEAILRRSREGIQNYSTAAGEILDESTALAQDFNRRQAAAATNKLAAQNWSNRPPFHFGKMATKAEQNLRGIDPATGMSNRWGLTPTAEREATRAQKLVDDAWAVPGGITDDAGNVLRPPMPPEKQTFRYANQLKQDAQRGIDYSGKTPELQTRAERSVARGMRESIEEQVGEAYLDSTMPDTLRNINRRTGDLIDVETLAAIEAEKQLSRKPWGQLLFAGGASAGASIGNLFDSPGLGLAAGAGLGALKLFENRIPTWVTHGIEGLRQGAAALTPWAGRNAAGASRAAASAVGQGVSRAATKPEPDEEDRNAYVKGNGG